MSKISVHHIIVISSASSIILFRGTRHWGITDNWCITQKYNFRIGKAESPGYQYFPVII